MKRTYRPLTSDYRGGQGRLSISITLVERGDLLDFEKYNKDIDFAEKEFLRDATEVIENRIHLKKSLQKTGSIQTVELYETSEGVIVEIARDEFEGLVVESEDKETINRIFQELLKLQSL
ncbi:MAG: hypothetical protein HUU45_05305 [Leptospiraceae bacterium]|nr:hypothetical protein [Leptospiraceae bacterium]